MSARETDLESVGPPQCDTFSRSSQAVFELSMRFSAPFTYEADIDSEEKKIALRKATFHELTQGQQALASVCYRLPASVTDLPSRLAQFASGVTREWTVCHQCLSKAQLISLLAPIFLSSSTWVWAGVPRSSARTSFDPALLPSHR